MRKILTNVTFSNKEILEVLKGKDSKKKDEVFRYIYKELNESLKKFILSNGGNKEDVHDVIQDAIIIYYEKVQDASLEIHSTVLGYIYQTGKYIWYDRRFKLKKHPHIEIDSNDDRLISNDEGFDMFHIDKTVFVKKLFLLIGEKCKKILIQSVYENKSMEEVAKLNGFKNSQVARNKKHKCLKKLKEIIKTSTYFQLIIGNINI